MQKVRIHPLFVLLCLLLLLAGKGLALGAASIAVALHEAGHYFCAKSRGFLLKDISLMPYGAVMYAEDGLPDKDCFPIALAGPTVNFCVCVLLCALWWVFPPLQTVTKIIFSANLSIGLFNLLPCYPLDGGRAVLSLAKNKKRCLAFLRAMGFVFGAASGVLFCASLFFQPAPYLAALSAMFFAGAVSDVKRESFRLAVADNYFTGDLSVPLEEKTLYVLSDMKLRRLTSSLSGKFTYRIIVVKEGKEIACLKGQAIEKMFFENGEITLGEYLSQNNLVGV